MTVANLNDRIFLYYSAFFMQRKCKYAFKRLSVVRVSVRLVLLYLFYFAFNKYSNQTNVRNYFMWFTKRERKRQMVEPF